MPENFINIKFPFEDDPKGKLLGMNQTSADAIKSDLLHLLLTNENERLFLPTFGVNLRRYLFEQNDDITSTGIRKKIEEKINRYIPNLAINEISTTKSESNEHSLIVRIDYTVTSSTFNSTDFVEIEL